MNSLIFLLLVAANLFQFLAVPILPSVWAWTLIPLALTSNTLWSMIHEGIHGHIPRWQGAVLACLFGSSFTFLSAAHLTHHALNRTEAEQLEIVPRGTPMWRARIKYYFFLCGGLYMSELFIPMAFILPLITLMKIADHSQLFAQRLIDRAVLGKQWIIVESFSAISFLLLSAYLYADRWPLLLAIVLARALFISALDYIYHYGNPVGDAQAAFNLWLPHPLRILVMNFNLHRVHHESPRTKWTHLTDEALFYHDTFFRAAARVWKGPK